MTAVVSGGCFKRLSAERKIFFTLRVDLAVLTKERAFVFELKLQRTEGKEEELLAEAIRQAQENHYADKYKFDHKYVHTLAVVFDEKTHQLVAWKDV